MTPLRPSASFELPSECATGSMVAFNLGPDGVAYFAFTLEPLDYRTESNGFAIFPKTRPDRPQRYRVLALRDDVVVLDLFIEDEPFNLHDIQPLGDELLLICVRSHRRRDDDIEANVRVYGRDGRFRRALCLGDGIQTVQATAKGDIWVAYFDEGVFGNFGWEYPLGASGLVRWDRDGHKRYEYDPQGRADTICDCYALNVASATDVWLYYYTPFPLVHVREDRIQAVYPMPVAGAHAFAVASDRALFHGGYDDHNILHLVAFGVADEARVLGRYTPVDATGAEIVPLRVVGRGSTLCLLDERRLHRYALDLTGE